MPPEDRIAHSGDTKGRAGRRGVQNGSNAHKVAPLVFSSLLTCTFVIVLRTTAGHWAGAPAQRLIGNSSQGLACAELLATWQRKSGLAIGAVTSKMGSDCRLSVTCAL